MDGRLEQLELNGSPVQVIPYPTVDEISEIDDALEDFYSSYDPNESKNPQLHSMPAIPNFILSADHCYITKYTLEYRLCGKQGCMF